MQNDQPNPVVPAPVEPAPIPVEPMQAPAPMPPVNEPPHESPPPVAPVVAAPPTVSLPTTKKRSMLPLIMIVVVLLLVATAITGYILSQRKPLEKVVANLPLATQSPAPVSQASTVPDGWKAYSDTTYGLKFLYPADATFTAQEATGSYLISKVGSDQMANTELTDGLSVDVMVAPLTGSLQDIVADDKAKIVNPEVGTAGETTLYSIGSLSGYTYSYAALGTATYYYFPLGTDYYVRVADASVDPGTKGYKALVGTMLQSIEYTPNKPLDGGM